MPALWVRKESRRRTDQEDRRVSEGRATVGIRKEGPCWQRLTHSGLLGGKLCVRMIRPGLGKAQAFSLASTKLPLLGPWVASASERKCLGQASACSMDSPAFASSREGESDPSGSELLPTEQGSMMMGGASLRMGGASLRKAEYGVNYSKRSSYLNMASFPHAGQAGVTLELIPGRVH